MEFISEGRLSDSPYIEMVWRGQAFSDYFPVCPADARWNLLLLKQNGRLQVSIEGPLTRAMPKTQPDGTEWLVIKFKLGAFMPFLPVGKLRDGAVPLNETGSKTFWLNGSTWQFPDYENIETFVNRLARNEMLVSDPVVKAALQDQPHPLSSRTVRRRFLLTTGLTPKLISQIERAQQAAALLEQGVSILDTVESTGYADQPHLTRALKYFIGQTPAQIARLSLSRVE